MMQARVVVVNVISVSYSGSTWLNLLLGAHPDAVSVGEAKRLLRTPRPVCSLHPESCPLFRQVEPMAAENVFLQIARAAGKRFLIVNNSRKLLACQDHPQIESRFIHLMRDGRATTASYMRKTRRRSMWQAARWWVHDVKRNERLMNRQRGLPVTVRYEDIQADTPRWLQSLCTHVGMHYDPAMLEYWNVDHHFIGGNVGTLLSLIHKRGGDAPDEWEHRLWHRRLDWDLGYYKQADPACFRDERWMRELTPWQRRVFRWIAGRTNRRYGYPAQ